MSLTTIKGGGHRWPDYYQRFNSALGLGAAQVIGGAGEKSASVFSVPKTGTIDRVIFKAGTVTTAQTLRAGLQTVDATTGFPTGTAYGGMVAGTQAAPATNTLYEVTLGTSATATRGDKIAMVVEFDATAGNLQIATQGCTRDLSTGFPYNCLYTTAWAKQGDGNCVPIVGVRYSDGTYEFVGSFLASVVTSTTFNSGSAADEIGNKITLNDAVRTNGFWWIGTASGDFDAVLYDAANNVVASVSVDKDLQRANGTASLFNLPWTAAAELPIGTYRLVIKPTTTTNVSLVEYTVLNNAMLDSNPGGSDMVKTTRVDAGAWTDTTTAQVAFLGLLIDQFDNGIRTPRLRRAA